MASTTGDQSPGTSTDERPRGSRGGSSRTSPLERLRTAPPAPARGAVVPEAPERVPVQRSDASVEPAPIVRLPSPPRTPEAGDGADQDITAGADDGVSEQGQTSTGSRDRRDAGEGAGGGTAGRGAGGGWDAVGVPLWLSGAPPAPPAPPRIPDSEPRDRDSDDADLGTVDLGVDVWGSGRWDGSDADWEWDDDEPPGGRPRSRFAVAPPAAIALILVGVIACVVAGYALWKGDSPAPVVDFPAAAANTSTVPSGVQAPAGDHTPTLGQSPEQVSPEHRTPAPQADSMVVSVVGLVARPGLIRLPPGARVGDAIKKAGGARKNADLLSLNLAQQLRDGDQVLVGYAGGNGEMSMRSAVVGPGATGAPPAAGESTAPSPSDGEAPTAGSGTVNLNTASQTELETLPGVGPVTAKSILDWRQRNGRFTSVDQLTEVDGIGPARLEKLRDKVTV